MPSDSYEPDLAWVHHLQITKSEEIVLVKSLNESKGWGDWSTPKGQLWKMIGDFKLCQAALQRSTRTGTTRRSFRTRILSTLTASAAQVVGESDGMDERARVTRMSVHATGVHHIGLHDVADCMSQRQLIAELIAVTFANNNSSHIHTKVALNAHPHYRCSQPTPGGSITVRNTSLYLSI